MSTVNNIDNSDDIILGSGELYVCKFTGEIPTDEEIETEANRAGNIKGGAKLEYSTSSQTVQSDNRRVKKTVITDEVVKLVSGMITWAKRWVLALIATARVDETTKPGHRVFKIGGAANQSKDRYLFRFVHTKESGRKVRVTVTGRNTGTISMAFNPDNPTTVDGEITADTLDKDGTLVIFDEELEGDGTATVVDPDDGEEAGGDV